MLRTLRTMSALQIVALVICLAVTVVAVAMFARMIGRFFATHAPAYRGVARLAGLLEYRRSNHEHGTVGTLSNFGSLTLTVQ